MNWPAIFVAVVINQALGFIWYSQLFGHAWLESIGKSKADIHHTPEQFVASIVGAFLMAIALSCLVRGLNRTTAFAGAKTGFMLWLGFVLPTVASHYMFLGHSWTTVAVDAGYQLVSLKIMGAMLAVWRKK